jgi:hypothetical protein
MTIDLSSLSADGDTIELDDGRKLRLRIEADDTSVMDSELFYGEFAWVERSRDYVHATPRPEGFDGNAEKLWTAGGDQYWWQPPRGDYELSAKRGSKEFDEFRELIRDLMSWGFKQVGLELLDGVDAYHRPVVKEAQWLGGIDSLEGGYLADVLSDLLAEIPL